LQTQRHKLDIAANKLRHERQTLVDRMRDDYGIDLAAEAATEASGAAASAAGSLGARSAVEREIAELREQLAQIGSVNLDALAELDDLEARFGTLSQQYRDLVDAKAALERIIQRINVDSRQLFLDTLEVVRGHFRELFRRLFGGGEADIRLDEGEDVLECGIDIVACPPGKEACSISLLSGGEKTLTCVALLLAVFRSKPSPFCILDEVDAALDEANIGRFVQVLRDFLSFTQFLVVTHSKKTMAGADTLYGVTMQESGVSKHVSVRFEDVSEDGHIHVRGDSTLRRAA
jgi:chromosome segregation protein